MTQFERCYRDLIRAATWYAAMGFIRAAAETEIRAMELGEKSPMPPHGGYDDGVKASD